MTKTFTWVGAAAGFWQTASNWNDLTDGQNPSSIVPGAQDVAQVGTTDLYGTGDVGLLEGGSPSGGGVILYRHADGGHGGLPLRVDAGKRRYP